MEEKKRYVTLKVDFESGNISNVKVAESREEACENLKQAVEEEINTEISDYDVIDEDWKEELLSQLKRVCAGDEYVVNDTLNNEAYYIKRVEE